MSIKTNCPKCNKELLKENLNRHLKICDGTGGRRRKHCIKCNREISLSCYDRHVKSCCGLSTKDFKCKYCEKDYTNNKYGLAPHQYMCTQNPNRGKNIKTKITTPGWNKGRTKETCPIVNKTANTLRQKYARGELVNPMKGKHLKDETKQKLRDAQLKLTYRRVSKRTRDYIKLDGTVVQLDSTWEEAIARRLDSLNIWWIRPYPLKWIDNEGVKRNYYPDFFLPLYNLYIDPKSKYTCESQKEKLDYLLHKYSNLIIITDLKLCENIEKILLSYKLGDFESTYKNNNSVLFKKEIKYSKHTGDVKEESYTINNLKDYKCKKYTEKFCVCGNKINYYSENCNKCASKKNGLTRRKVDRPDMYDLSKEITYYGYMATAKKYGVSDNTIRKWFRTEGMTVPKLRKI
ncbi:MAG: hypothetical protein KC414_06185 [Romboutsia sp.]|nr:hypothetical protein [Romboutsia sp.]